MLALALASCAILDREEMGRAWSRNCDSHLQIIGMDEITGMVSKDISISDI